MLVKYLHDYEMLLQHSQAVILHCYVLTNLISAIGHNKNYYAQVHDGRVSAHSIYE